MEYDFSHEDDQKEQTYGPVPSGSIVVVTVTLLEPSASKMDSSDRLISVAASGLRQLYIQCEVNRGQFKGVQWRQAITLPYGMQNIELSEGQAKSARIGGAMLKGMLLAANKPTRLQSLKQFEGLRIPVKVKLQDKGYEAENGHVYWRNEIASVITPNRKEYGDIRQKGEIINPDGAISGNLEKVKRAADRAASSGYGGNQGSEANDALAHLYRDSIPQLDEVPF